MTSVLIRDAMGALIVPIGSRCSKVLILNNVQYVIFLLLAVGGMRIKSIGVRAERLACWTWGMKDQVLSQDDKCHKGNSLLPVAFLLVIFPHTPTSPHQANTKLAVAFVAKRQLLELQRLPV